MAAGIVWIIDTSSIAEIRRSVENTRRVDVFGRLTDLVNQGQLLFPRQVLDELERVADQAAPDQQYLWAKRNQGTACLNAPSLDSVKAVLAVVPRVLDPDKDTGVDEADPYVLAKAADLPSDGVDGRIVTGERSSRPSSWTS
jgi:hypothetical protein